MDKQESVEPWEAVYTRGFCFCSQAPFQWLPPGAHEEDWGQSGRPRRAFAGGAGL